MNLDAIWAKEILANPTMIDGFNIFVFLFTGTTSWSYYKYNFFYLVTFC